MPRVLFVCLGNICRSPMAEAVFRHEVEKQKLASHFPVIDSAGTSGFHIGDQPDPRTLKVLQQNGIKTQHSCRQVTAQDFDEFDYILCMDESNLSNCLAFGQSKAKVQLFGEYGDPKDKIIHDPYYGGLDGYQVNFKQIQQCTEGFLRSLGLNSA